MTEAGAPRRHLRVSAYAVCTDADRILLCRIAQGATVGHDGWWTLPGGGLDHGEDPRDGVLRELTEETGLEGRLGELLTIDSLHQRLPLHGIDTDYHGIRILYRVAVTGGELRDEAHGSTDTCRWMTRPEAAAERLVDIAELGMRLGIGGGPPGS